MTRAPQGHYAYAFGVVGLVGGLFTAFLFHEGLGPITVLITLTTGLCAAGVGLAVSQRSGWLWSSLAFGVLGGMVNGLLLAMILAPGGAAIFGVPFGGLCSLPFLPALALMAHAGSRYGRARARTELSALDQRALLRTAATSIAIAGLFVGLLVSQQGDHIRNGKLLALGVVELAAFVAIVGLALADRRVLGKLLGAEQQASALRLVAPNEADVPAPGLDCIDVGVGDDRYLHEEGAYTFRSAPSVRLSLVGDPVRARNAAVRAVCVDAAALLAGIALFGHLLPGLLSSGLRLPGT